MTAFRLVTIALTIAATAPLSAQDQREINFVRNLLTQLQAPSFSANREYCGTIGATADGQLVASKPRRGGRDSCRPLDPRDAVEVFASFHTHAGFDEDADSELPSVSDVYNDMDEGIDGYLSTPGGRFWFIDGQTGVVRQLCGLGCLPQDADFEPGLWGKIRERYTLDQLERREDSF